VASVLTLPQPDAGSAARARILDVVRREPGITVTRLRQKAGLGWSSLYHHLGRLESARAVTTVAAGRRRIVVLAGRDEPEATHRARALLLNATLRRLARAIAEGTGTDVHALARATRMGERTVYHHLRSLVGHGLVASSVPRRHLGLRATPLLLSLLEKDAGERP
jgi:DNA-binding transcriptional ArsR family regulator